MLQTHNLLILAFHHRILSKEMSVLNFNLSLTFSQRRLLPELDILPPFLILSDQMCSNTLASLASRASFILKSTAVVLFISYAGSVAI